MIKIFRGSKPISGFFFQDLEDLWRVTSGYDLYRTTNSFEHKLFRQVGSVWYELCTTYHNEECRS